jgi:hypothetical protein
MPATSDVEDSVMVCTRTTELFDEGAKERLTNTRDSVAVLGEYVYFEGGEVAQYVLGEVDVRKSRESEFSRNFDT